MIAINNHTETFPGPKEVALMDGVKRLVAALKQKYPDKPEESENAERVLRELQEAKTLNEFKKTVSNNMVRIIVGMLLEL